MKIIDKRKSLIVLAIVLVTVPELAMATWEEPFGMGLRRTLAENRWLFGVSLVMLFGGCVLLWQRELSDFARALTGLGVVCSLVFFANFIVWFSYPFQMCRDCL